MGFDFSRMLTDEEAKKIYSKVLKKEESVISLSKRLGISIDEVYGLANLLTYFDYPVEISEFGSDVFIRKLRKH